MKGERGGTKTHSSEVSSQILPPQHFDEHTLVGDGKQGVEVTC